ncbi:MAG: hypothetical protein PHC53_04150 [Patescibacteria group bacterium]|nr:hypothetical protein [Patescibacteria group bacterium]
MTRSLSLATVEDLIKVLDKDFVPGSTFSPGSIAQDCNVRLCMPVLPSYTIVDFDEILGCRDSARLVPPTLEALSSEICDDEISNAA